jgi:hypothetical protein
MKAILVLPVRHSLSSVVSSVKLEMKALNWNVIVFLSVSPYTKDAQVSGA